MGLNPPNGSEPIWPGDEKMLKELEAAQEKWPDFCI
jgi:hypothetical protein